MWEVIVIFFPLRTKYDMICSLSFQINIFLILVLNIYIYRPAGYIYIRFHIYIRTFTKETLDKSKVLKYWSAKRYKKF